MAAFRLSWKIIRDSYFRLENCWQIFRVYCSYCLTCLVQLSYSWNHPSQNDCKWHCTLCIYRIIIPRLRWL